MVLGTLRMMQYMAHELIQGLPCHAMPCIAIHSMTKRKRNDRLFRIKGHRIVSSQFIHFTDLFKKIDDHTFASHF